MPAAMFNPQATSMPQCCAMLDLARSIKGAHDVRARGLPEFPVTWQPKSGLNFAAFCQASPPACISRRCRAGARRERIIGGQTPVKIR
jgi:hypothetical protein